jgi:hypothetical protein
LGLSGGLDSRLLLTLLLSRKIPFILHLFGVSGEPDVQIAQKIARDKNIALTRYDDPIPSVQECFSQVEQYVCQTSLVGSPSTMLKLRYYNAIHAEGKVMIDGGMGEIARRQFMNRLLWRGKRFLREGRAEVLAPYVRSCKAPLFTREVTHLMWRGIQEQLKEAWESMPPIEKIGIENFLDLMVVRYRFPNYGGLEQARMDEHILSWMPFAQPSFVNAAFGLPIARRKNGRLFRQLIQRLSPSLATYPLVKGMTTYPFRFPTVSAWVYTKAKCYFVPEFVDPTPVVFLTAAEEVVRDMAHSAAVKEYAAYDYPLVVRTVDEFYSGQTDRARFVEWWLAFELWRKAHCLS